jgi:hypothetical protein
MRKISALGAALALLANVAFAANVPQVTLQQSSLPGDLPDVNLAISNVNAAVNSQSMATFSNFRNYLDNGEFAVQQRGTAATAGGTTGAPVYVPDRWAVSTNVTSGAGFGQVITATPSPLTGSAQSFKVYRNSGALTQPVCAIQEIPTSESQDLQGQTVTLSFYAQALAGLNADNGNVINAYIIYGTGTDQGLGTLTASPAITPAWTGINSSITSAYTLSASSWNRYTLTGFIPTSTNEIGVEICFTPTATGAGTSDGFALSDVQLEQGGTASSFEYRPYGVELTKYQRYFVQIADPANTVTLPSSCNVVTANTTVRCSYILPVTMRATPTVTVSTATSFGIWLTAGTAGTCTTLAATASASTPNAAALTCTTAGTIALGTGTALIGAGTAGTLAISADF